MKVLLLLLALCAPSSSLDSPKRVPNIVVILADDLGYAEVGCYGQAKIDTPNIDRLAAEGMRFTQHYSGSPVCAPSRCSLLTGYHTGHAAIRDNIEMGGWERGAREGQAPLPADTRTIGHMLKEAGYATAAIGKWGLGGPGSVGHPNKQGFDFWYGYLCQRLAHNYYPEHLWRNETKHVLEGNAYFSAHQRLESVPADPSAFARYQGRQYAPDLMLKEALSFIRSNRERPFFLYYATPVPHASIQVPEDSLKPYQGRWPETVYLGNQGYLPHPTPRAGYAAMVTRFDRDVGRLLRLLDKLKLADDTLVIFTSDNGPTFNGGTDSGFFNSTGGLRGLKCSVYEGGIRVPFIARWPGRIRPKSTTDHVSAFWDILPTLADVAGMASPKEIDGISFLPTLLQRGKQTKHTCLYWEYPAGAGKRAVRFGQWKAVQLRVNKDANAPVALFDLDRDTAESVNVAADHPAVVERARRYLAQSRR